jgi:hypothetical protein
VGIRELSKYTHIWFAVDYVIKWVEQITTKSVDHATDVKMFKDIILPRCGVPRFIITNDGFLFLNVAFRKFMYKYSVSHRFSSSYHPQTCGQVGLSNRELKLILQKTINDALWIYKTAFKIVWECIHIKWSMENLITSRFRT